MTGNEIHYEAFFSSGVSRDTRVPVALLPENVEIDEREMEHDLVFAGSLSDYINFFDSANEPNGTWYPFFGKSEPVLLAMIGMVDLDAIDKDFNNHLYLFDITNRREKKLEELQALFDLTMGIAFRINHWQKHLSRDQDNSVYREIESQIEGRLRDGFFKLRRIDEICARHPLVGHSFKGEFSMFGEKWKMKEERELPQLGVDGDEIDPMVIVLQALRNVYNDFYHALIHIVKYTRKNLEPILEEKHSNRPDISLYIAFTRLMQNLRMQMNTIPERHIDFYYFDVLKHKRLTFNPDHALVKFTLQENVKVHLLPSGTELVAGKDETGKELLYTTDSDLYINKATIASLHTLFVSRNPAVKTGVENKSLRMVKGIFSSTDPSAMADGTPLDWWPLMGCDQLDLSSSNMLMKEAGLGFSIASPALFLSEGQRDVTVIFSLDDREEKQKYSAGASVKDVSGARLKDGPKATILNDPAVRFKQQSKAAPKNDPAARGHVVSKPAITNDPGTRPKDVAKVATKNDPGARLKDGSKVTIKNDPKAALKNNPESTLKNLRRIIAEVMREHSRNSAGAIFYLFSKALSISITAAEGWQQVGRYAFNYDDQHAELVLRFSFSPSDPAVVAHDPAIHGEGFDSQWPVLRMMLNTENAPVYAYSLLSDILVNRIRIHTDVKGMRKLSLYNNAGKLSTEKPFQPFGAQPIPGSYMLIGNSEAMNKNLQSLQLHLSWNDLPPEGFTEYYKGYPGDITNASFTTGIALQQQGYFLPLREDQQQKPLFHDAPTDHPERGIPVMTETVIDDIDIAKLRQRPSWGVPKQQMVFGPETQDGFLKLELLTPPIGFGGMEYAPLLSETILANSRTKKPKPLPRLPYTPVLSNVSLDYSAEFDSDNSIGDDGELPIGIYRHHPFGMERVAVASSFRNVPLFPKYENEGYLFIGISGLELPQPLTLLFKLSDESFYAHESPDAVMWSYLCKNTWKPFRDDRVLSDGTKRFVQPGIVELDLPAEMSNDSTIMPAGLHWICASVREKTHCVSHAKTIFTQAVSVTWKDAGNTFTHLDVPLPAGSITKTKLKTPAIKEVLQPIPSTGGCMPEEKHEAYTRLSERLGHRNRALLPIDYERLVLQQFPTVYKAQCFPDMNGEGQHKRGNVLVVVVPDIDRRKDINIFRPKDSYSLLQEITAFLKERAAPFVRIEVRNPLYERVKVIASIKFKKGLDSGFYLRQLNQDMRAYLSPWLYDSHVEVRLGGVISRSDVLGFIERQPYVDFVTALSVVVTKDYNGFFTLEDTARMSKGNQDDEDSIHAGKPWSILVTASRHLFTAIDDEIMSPADPRGIDNLAISDDFIITQ